jgi:carotenoid 1,2-hydratase
VKPVSGTLPFDQPVCPGGYAWWYVDALSDDGAHGLTIIVFVGSVFSPRYAKARRDTQHADPERFCAVNVSLYDIARGGKVWALTEHPSFARAPNELRVGATSMRWVETSGTEPAELHIEIVEHQTEFFGRRGAPLRGRVRVCPTALFGPRVELDRWRSPPRHRWYPIAPHARVEVEFDAPQLRFSGSGYHDANEGDEGLEHAFRSWNWSRCEIGDETVIAYDVVDLQGQPHARAWRFVPKSAAIEDIPEHALGPAGVLPATQWRVPRAIRSDREQSPQLRCTLEDSPFYARSLVDVQLGERSGVAVHESISLQRFASGWVRFLLPFKIRRT